MTARALLRTSKIGAGVIGGLGAIHAGYHISDGGNIFEETRKAAAEVGATLVGVGYLGALGYKHLGTLGSLVGIGAGALIGSKAPELLFEHNSKVI